MLADLDTRIGLDRLRALHVNDAAAPLGSNRDRHANVLEGELGERLGAFLAHPAVQELPAVMETPGPDGHGPDAPEMQKLRDLHKRWTEKEEEAPVSGLLDQQQALQEEAAAVLADLELLPLLERVGRPVQVGSVALGLMVARDIDVTVLCPVLETPAIFSVLAPLAGHSRIRELRFRDDTAHWNVDANYPDGDLLGPALPQRDRNGLEHRHLVHPRGQPPVRPRAPRVAAAEADAGDARGHPPDQGLLPRAAVVQQLRDLHGRPRPRRANAPGVPRLRGGWFSLLRSSGSRSTR